MRRSRCFVLDNFARTARFLLRQNQSVQLRLICIYVAQPLSIGTFGMGIDVTKITLLSWKPLYLAGKVWFNIIKYEYVKEFHFCVIFLAEKFVLSMITRIFAPPVPTKPLNDAQMRGLFCFYGYMATRIPFIKTYSTPHELVQLLKTRGMEFWILD